MRYTKEEIGFAPDDELEIVHFATEEKRLKAERFLDSRNILNHYWDVKGTLPNDERGLLMRVQDAARIKASFDDIKDISSNLLT